MPADSPALTQTLRDYQRDCVADAVRFAAKPDELRRRLYASPTGTGKGTIELATQAALPGSWILTPSLEILRGFLERQGVEPASSVDKLAEQGFERQITTPIRFRNMLAEGHAAPPVVIYDEVHHAIGETVTAGDLFGLLPGATWLGFTATPFRGTPKGTARLRADWGEPIVVLTVPEAVKAGYMALPTFDVVPLIDDDELVVVNGEFAVKAASEAAVGEIAALADLVLERRCGPTAVAVPSSMVARELVGRLGDEAVWVNQATSTRDRATAYESCRLEQKVLVDIATLTEGVDFPWLRTLIDAQPTLSPVRWMQRLGRIMRPKEERPSYVACCRNLERHSYLLMGAVPRSSVLAALKAFGAPSSRPGRRVGLEQLHKFKVVEIPLADDGVGLMYSLVANDRETGQRVDRVVIIDAERVVCGERVNGIDARSERVWGDYRQCDVWSAMDGFRSSARASKPREPWDENPLLSVKQANWWKRSARRCGLDPAAVTEIDSRQFNALPVLSQLGVRLGHE